MFDQRVADEGIPTIVNMVDALDGYEEDGVTLRHDRASVTLDDGTVRRDTIDDRPLRQARPRRPAVPHRRQPAVTYLLFLIGLALLIFEFFTAGVGVAGVVGAVCLVLACNGLADVAGARLGGRR